MLEIPLKVTNLAPHFLALLLKSFGTQLMLNDRLSKLNPEGENE